MTHLIRMTRSGFNPSMHVHQRYKIVIKNCDKYVEMGQKVISVFYPKITITCYHQLYGSSEIPSYLQSGSCNILAAQGNETLHLAIHKSFLERKKSTLKAYMVTAMMEPLQFTVLCFYSKINHYL